MLDGDFNKLSQLAAFANSIFGTLSNVAYMSAVYRLPLLSRISMTRATTPMERIVRMPKKTMESPILDPTLILSVL